MNTPIPVGVFTVTGPASYEFIASSNTDFTPSPNDPSNGPGTYRMDGTIMILESGAFREKWGNPSGELFPRDGTIMDLWFANTGGGILNCQFR